MLGGSGKQFEREVKGRRRVAAGRTEGARGGLRQGRTGGTGGGASRAGAERDGDIPTSRLPLFNLLFVLAGNVQENRTIDTRFHPPGLRSVALLFAKPKLCLSRQ